MSKKIRQLKATVLMMAMIASAMPAQLIFAAGEENIIYQNDFESEIAAVTIGSNKAMEYSVEGDKNNGWLNIFQQDLYYEYANQIAAGSTLKFDILIPEEATFSGVLKAQAVTKMGNDWAWTQCETIPEIAAGDFTSLGNGYKSYTVSISFGTEIEQVQGLKAIVPCLSASNCTYSGKIYLDNVKLVAAKEKATEANIVDSTLKIANQTAISVTKNTIKANGKTIPIANTVKLVDDRAVPSVAKLYAYLEAVGKSDSVLYGHQNDTYHKAGSKDLTTSDTEDVTGSIAAVMGVDTLSLVGNEFPGGLEDQYSGKLTNAQLVTECAKVTKKAAEEGAIITLSAHMPNFAHMAARAENKKGAKGTLDWKTANFKSEGNNTDGSWVTGGDIVTKIMPGGELNYMFNAYLDMVAQYAKEVGDETPIMFRPFHENTGSWFWWGAAFCDEEEYKNLYKYTVEYLRDTKDIHNILYVYGPGAEAENTNEYAVRYPGDEYVDMVGFDMYHQNPAVGDTFINNFKAQLKVVEEFATAHNKLMAVTETGISNGNEVLLKADNARKDWYNEIIEAMSSSNASYFLLWANFSTNQHYTPYVVSKNGEVLRGHEMLDNFISFYNNNNSIFAKEQGDFSKLEVATAKNTAITGYIAEPASGSRMLKATTIKASLTNVADDAIVEFIAKDKTGVINKKITAQKDESGYYVGTLDAKSLEALGQSAGTITVTVDGISYSKINAKFNMPEPVVIPTVVDTFEDYYGDNEVMNNSWAVGRGTGCAIEASLTTEKHYNSKYGLAFKYTLVDGGYIGITKSMNNADWSSKNALQFWTLPDGNNKKVVIQVTSGGNVFEVYLNEYENYQNSTKPMLVTIPFSSFVGRDDKAAVFEPSKIESFGLWCNAITPDGVDAATYKLESTIYYDQIQTVTSNVDKITFETKS